MIIYREHIKKIRSRRDVACYVSTVQIPQNVHIKNGELIFRIFLIISADSTHHRVKHAWVLFYSSPYFVKV
jgi:hypothetical protein